MKDEKGITFTKGFKKYLDESGGKPNKIWEVKGSEFYKRSMKSWLKVNDINKYSTQNEEKSVVADRFITNLKHKTYKFMNSISKNVYIESNVS